MDVGQLWTEKSVLDDKGPTKEIVRFSSENRPRRLRRLLPREPCHTFCAHGCTQLRVDTRLRHSAIATDLALHAVLTQRFHCGPCLLMFAHRIDIREA
jgi:hypothetical protein